MNLINSVNVQSWTTAGRYTESITISSVTYSDKFVESLRFAVFCFLLDVWPF